VYAEHPHRHSRESYSGTTGTTAHTPRSIGEGEMPAHPPAPRISSPAPHPTVHPLRRTCKKLRERVVRGPQFNFAKARTSEEFIDQAERYVLRVRASYDSRAMWHRRFYRLSGVLLIVLGGALPLLASSDLVHKNVVIAVIGFVVATVTALRGFYHWDAGWALLRETEFDITKRYLDWKALQFELSDPHRLQRETHRLLDDLIAIRKNEARSFFKSVPDVGRPGPEQTTAPSAARPR